ncbi:MAG: response regulator transcription factor [Candidatus Eremiobacteraeota bacterium]|nr:response regulator transcription factor [Candidatus Eremiobacteraeota bacterium]MCW5872104.1 response regulator transcription factor [Candidatus Eremiobacteraeota bacterium]
MARILLVEDDPRISRPLARELARELHTCDLAEDGEAGWSFLEAGNYDLAILDILLPRLTGIELCQRIRSRGLDTPVLLLTALDEVKDKVAGLDSGADDFLVKPFALDELHARIRALLRRKVTTPPVLSWGDQLHLDPQQKQARAGGRQLELTPREYQLLELLMRSPGVFFTAAEILDKVWGWDSSPGKGTVKTHIKSLRDKLRLAGQPEVIETRYGRGYRLRPT